MKRGATYRSAGTPWLSWRGPVVACALILGFTFLQIERGTGNRTLVLLFTLFDMLLVAAFATAFLSLTRRWRVSLLTGAALVLLIYFASWLKMQYTAMAAQAGDLMTLYTAWELVWPFAWRAMAVVAALTVLIVIVFAIEKPLYRGNRTRGMLGLVATLLFAVCAVIDDQLPRNDAALIAAGPGAKIALFYRSVYQRSALLPASFPAMGKYCCMVAAGPPSATFNGDLKPNLVVVLQESTFPRSNLRGYEPARNFLFDGAAPLKVHVRGSGTWVEEFAVLHGVPPTVYGDQFIQINSLGPALRLPGRLAPLLAEQGYDTTTVYPTAGQMLAAESMHRSLGMQRFVSCEEIDPCHAAADWNKTADSVFFDKVLETLRGQDKPQFIFTATMRQHSPHFERFPLKHYKKEVMLEYDRRLALSSTDAEAFISALRQLPRPTLVLMFGDHIPSDVVAAFDERDFAADPFQTFFNIYDSTGKPRAAELMARYSDVPAVDSAFLDVLLLDYAGFGGNYISTKLRFMQACGGRYCGQSAPDEKVALSKR